MVFKGNLDVDPRGLIYESYRMEGIVVQECRSIFLDWALGTPMGSDLTASLEKLIAEYGVAAPDHPMTGILREGLAKTKSPRGRRGGAKGRGRVH